MFAYRITKYDPLHRDAAGAYKKDDWTDFSDIGRTFSGGVLTNEDYVRVEASYLAVAESFMREAAQEWLEVRDLEAPKRHPSRAMERVALASLSTVVRSLLRNEYWCRLENTESYVHVGYDFYMYVGVPCECPASLALARSRGLFVEPFTSAYAA